MTINKAQGQSVKVEAVDLNADCFSHGQLYVIFPRVGEAKNLYRYTKNHRVMNIVYKEALSQALIKLFFIISVLLLIL